MAATDIVADILAAVVEALGSAETTPVTGTGAPTNFREWTRPGFEGAGDRHFEVELTGMDEHGNTGTDNATVYVDAYLTLLVRMKFRNEGRPKSVFHGYVAKDVRTIQDRVQNHLRNIDGATPAGVKECRTNGEARIVAGEDPIITLAEVPFLVEYSDTAKTA